MCSEHLWAETELHLGIPVLPEVLPPLLSLSRRADFDPVAVLDLLQADIGLSCRLLAASPVSPPGSLGDAVLRLGPSGVRALAGDALSLYFFSATDPDLTLRLDGLWRSAIGCAERAREIARQVHPALEEQARLGGLLHNLPGLLESRSGASAASLEDCAVWLERSGGDGALADALRYQAEPVEHILDAHPLVRILNLAVRLEQARCEEGDPGYHAAETLLDLSRTTLYDLQQRADAQAEAIFSRFDPRNGAAGVYSAGESLELDLARQVRLLARLAGAERDLAAVQEGPVLLSVVQRQMRLLFGQGRVRLFSFDNTRNLLIDLGGPPGADAPLQIGVAAGRSLLAECLLQRRVMEARALSRTAAPVVDRQLCRSLHTEGLLCLPLLYDGARVGVMALGVGSPQWRGLEARADLLQELAAAIALAMLRLIGQKRL